MSKRNNDLKLQTRLVLIVAPALLVGLLVVGFSLITLNSIDNQAFYLATFAQDSADALQAGDLISRVEVGTLQYALNLGDQFIAEQDNAFAEVAQDSLAIDDYVGKTIIHDTKLYSDYMIELGITDFLNGMQDNLDAYNQSWDVITNPDTSVGAVGDETTQALDATSGALENVDSIYEAVNSWQEDSVARVDNQVLLFQIGSIIGILIFLALLVVTAVMVNRQVADPLADIVDAAGAFARGEVDLDEIKERIERTDEIGYLSRAFLKMVEEIQADEQTLKDEAAELRVKLENLTAAD